MGRAVLIDAACRAWARFPGMEGRVRCKHDTAGHPQIVATVGYSELHFTGGWDDTGATWRFQWTDDAPDLETGREEEQ